MIEEKKKILQLKTGKYYSCMNNKFVVLGYLEDKALKNIYLSDFLYTKITNRALFFELFSEEVVFCYLKYLTAYCYSETLDKMFLLSDYFYLQDIKEEEEIEDIDSYLVELKKKDTDYEYLSLRTDEELLSLKRTKSDYPTVLSYVEVLYQKFLETNRIDTYKITLLRNEDTLSITYHSNGIKIEKQYENTKENILALLSLMQLEERDILYFLYICE